MNRNDEFEFADQVTLTDLGVVHVCTQDLTRILNDRLESRLKGHRYASTPAERIEFQGALTELEIIMNELKVEYQARAGEAVGEGIV